MRRLSYGCLYRHTIYITFSIENTLSFRQTSLLLLLLLPLPLVQDYIEKQAAKEKQAAADKEMGIVKKEQKKSVGHLCGGWILFQLITLLRKA